jgi:hypothetical protein
MKIKEGETQATYFYGRLRVPDDILQLNGRDIAFVINVLYICVTYDRRT